MSQEQPDSVEPEVSQAAQALGKKRAKTLTHQHQADAARKLAAALTPKQRAEKASNAAKARWAKE